MLSIVKRSGGKGGVVAEGLVSSAERRPVMRTKQRVALIGTVMDVILFLIWKSVNLPFLSVLSKDWNTGVFL
jgi:hypothetical protein